MHATPGYWGEGGLKLSIEDYNAHLRNSAAAFQNSHPKAVVLLHDMYTTFGLVRIALSQLDIRKLSLKTHSFWTTLHYWASRSGTTRA